MNLKSIATWLPWLLANWAKIGRVLLAVALALGMVSELPIANTEPTAETAGSCSPADCKTVMINAAKYSTTPTRILTCCLAIVATACPIVPTPAPVPPTPPVGQGGMVSYGGSPATGGSVATGGAAVTFPKCDGQPGQMRAPRKSESTPRKFGPPTRPRDAMRAAPPIPVTGASVWWEPNDPLPLDQGSVGSCVGNDVAHVSATQPYTRHATQADALACYSAATKLDNGCAWDAKSCPGSYPPNDVGSYAESGFRAATSMGWFRGTRPVQQTLQGWHDALLIGPCGFDQNWYQHGFSPDRCGEVAITGALAGGHSTEALGFDVDLQRMWLRNSWGDWSLRGGFFFYPISSLQKLYLSGAEMVCPSVP